MFLHHAGIQSKLQYFFFSVGFDIEKAVQCFDSFQPQMERGEKRERDGRGKWSGGWGVAEKESWAAQCHTREDCRGGNKRMGGRLEGQAYQSVCEDRGERTGCLNHNRMEE